MTTIPIASLSPSKPPPADQSIRAIVSLLWPFSSSTKQCALLLAERDFRLRNHRGQVRVRFQGASAQAIAKGQVGIGDEVVVELRGSAWAGDASNVITHGKSVEGELLFRGELAIRLVKKADGRQVNDSIHVNETTPPPEDNDVNTTPARPIPSYLRASLEGADVVPIYSSPAFVSRMRLSEGKPESWDPFADVDRELEAEFANPRKKQRVSYGGVGRWKVAARTPSPEKEDVQMTTSLDAGQSDQHTSTDMQNVINMQVREQEIRANGQARSETELPSDVPTMDRKAARTTSAMAPPPLQRLEMPGNSGIGPHTPKLQPVPSSALPLPSPFPAEAKQLHTGVTSLAAANDHHGVSLAEETVPNGKDAEVIERSGNVPLHTEASQDFLDAIEEDEDDRDHPVLPGQPSFSSSVASTVPPEQASGVFHDSGSDDDHDDHDGSDNLHEDDHARRHRIPHPEYESDTEEDEDMYTQYTQQRDDELEEAARVRDGLDHDDQLDDADVEEVIDDMGEPPDSDDSDEEASEAQSQSEESDDEDVQDIDGQSRIRPSLIEVSSDPVDAMHHAELQVTQTEQARGIVADVPNLPGTKVPSAAGDNTTKLSQVGSALSDTFAQQAHAKTAAEIATATPTQPPPGLFSLDGAADSSKIRISTPQSQRERIMKKTYSSLFGFAKSPSPEKAQPPVSDFGTPTPASSSSGFSRIANDRFLAAGVFLERPVPPRAKIDETQSQDAAKANRTTETSLVELPVPARATIADTETSHSDSAASTISTQAKQMPLPARATIWDTQSPIIESSAAVNGLRVNQDALETGGGTIPKSVMKDDAANALVEPIAATEETGQTSQVGDVDDGSLLEAVHNAAPKVCEEQEEDKVLVERSSMIEETPKERLQNTTSPEQGRLQAEDSVPDGVAINPTLAAAMASGPDGFSAGSTPRPSQVEVIDLGDSSDEEHEDTADTASARGIATLPSQPLYSISDSTPATAPGNNTESQADEDLSRAEATHRQQDFERLLSRAEAPRHQGSESITQISQGSILQSDMLDTTQTTVDGRSEIATPYMDEYDTIVPNTSHDESMGVFQGQPNFFDDQMHGQAFEGNAAPQLTQHAANTPDERYNYNRSFQSATSIATDNSDRYQANATQRGSVAEHEQQEHPMQDHPHGNESQVTVLEAGSSSIVGATAQPLDTSLTPAQIGEVTEDQTMSDSITTGHHVKESEVEVEHSTNDVEMHDREQSSSFSAKALSQHQQRQPDLVLWSSFEGSQSAAVTSEDLATDVRSLREAVQLAESQVPQDDIAADQDLTRERTLTPAVGRCQQQERQSSEHTGPRSRLLISPDDSQHRLESQPFDTQLPIESVQKALPPTPQLTRGESLTAQGPEVTVNALTDDADVQSEEGPPVSSRQTRSSQKAVSAEGLQSPEKKASIRRSPRKSQIQSREPQELYEAATADASSSVLHKPATRQYSLDRPITPPPRSQRSQETVAAKKMMLSPKTKTPVRRSPRKTQAQTESHELADSRSVASSEDDELATDRNSLGSTARVPVTRSTKRALGKDTKAHAMALDMDDEVAVGSPSTHFDDTLQPERAACRSVTSRISAVPAVISNWFSPRHSTREEAEADSDVQADVQAETEVAVKADKDADSPKASPHRRKSNGVVTELSYYTPLSNIREKLNASSQAHGSKTVDVMAVVVDETSKPQRAKSGPRDHFTMFKITDPSLDAGASTSVEVFKHWHATLPSAQVGDVILLRSFSVRSKKRQAYLLSGNESAWCVWRYTEDEASSAGPSSQKGSPANKAKRKRDRNGSFSIEIKGPPVEYNRPQERQRAEELRGWWLEAQGEPRADAVADAAPSSPGGGQVGRKTRSQQKV